MKQKEQRVLEEAERVGMTVRQLPSGVWELKSKAGRLLTRELGSVSKHDLEQLTVAEYPRR